MEGIDDCVLINYLNNNLSDSERVQVENWIQASPDNEKTFEQLYFILQLTEKLHIIKTIDTDSALDRLKSRIHKQHRMNRVQNVFQRLQRVAAILFIPVLLFAGYMYKNRVRDVKMQYVEVKTNPGMVSSIELPDGSKVWLNAGGYLRYPVFFDSDHRNVELEGEGYFEVMHDQDKPFIVKTTSDYAVEVLGTSFNVSAYSDDDFIETTLVNGSVRLNLRHADGSQYTRLLRPEEKAIFQKMTRELKISTVNTEYETAWKDGLILFKNQSMDQVLRMLGRHYNVHFDVADPSIYKSIITAKFKNEQLPQVLEYLKLATGIKFKINKLEKDEKDLFKPNIVEIYK